MEVEGKGGSFVGKLAAGAATVGAAFGVAKLSGKGGAKADAEVCIRACTAVHTSVYGQKIDSHGS